MSSENALTKVQDLYVLQMELWKVLDGRVRSEHQKETAKKNLRAFSRLLKEVDPRYMGGEDVFASLLHIRSAAEQKLKGRTEAVRKR